MRNAYKSTGEILKCDPYNGICNSSIETAEHLYMLQDYCQTTGRAWLIRTQLIRSST